MKVRDCMTIEVRTCYQDDPLHVAADAMWEGDCGCVPVLASPTRPHVVGMISDRDTCMGTLSSGRPLHETPVREAMATVVHSCRPEDDVRVVAALMRSAEIRRVPVLDEGERLVGILTLADLLHTRSGSGRLPLSQKELLETVSATSRPRHAPVKVAAGTRPARAAAKTRAAAKAAASKSSERAAARKKTAAKRTNTKRVAKKAAPRREASPRKKASSTKAGTRGASGAEKGDRTAARSKSTGRSPRKAKAPSSGPQTAKKTSRAGAKAKSRTRARATRKEAPAKRTRATSAAPARRKARGKAASASARR